MQRPCIRGRPAAGKPAASIPRAIVMADLYRGLMAVADDAVEIAA
jgi:hypothetical protein